MTTRYRIGEFARLSGVTSKTLRFYDQIGIFRPSTVDPLTRYRYYLPQQLEELASILALKGLGVSLAAVQNLAAKRGSPESKRKLVQELQRLRQNLEESIQTSARSLNYIDATLADLDLGTRPIPVVLKRRPAIPIASIRSKVRSYTEIDNLEWELLNALPSQSIGDLRGTLWHRCADSGSLEGEPFVALKQWVPARGFYDLKQLSAATLACAYSGPDDDSAEQAYDAVKRWMAIAGYRLAGPKREIYLENMLEIQFPLQAA
jgi:DNA-binding transcriptional MerR regulator